MRVRITGGDLGNRFIKTLPTLRPTSDLVRKAVFDILGPRIQDASFLDLYAGSGAVGIEAVSRGAVHATLVDDHRQHAALIRTNVASVGLESSTTIRPTTTANFITLNTAPFDIIFADPWYEDSLDLTGWDAPTLLAPDGLIIIEHSIKNPPSHPNTLKVLQHKTYGDTALTFYTRA